MVAYTLGFGGFWECYYAFSYKVAYKFGPVFSRVCCGLFFGGVAYNLGLVFFLLCDLFFVGVAYRVF
jgi:hypothetical protein